MPVGRDRMDGNERFRQMVNNGNPKVLGVLLQELGEDEAKQLIEECYSKDTETALLHCVKHSHDGRDKKDADIAECCSLLLKYGAVVDAQDAMGRTALHWACSQTNTELAKVLVDAGADASLKDDTGYNALHIAIGTGAADCITLILKYQKEVINRLTDDGVAPLIAAIHKGDADVLKALVTSGADVNVQESITARTPLHYALYIKRRDLFDYLLENGADICKTDHRGTNIIHRCCAIQEPSFLHLVLLKAGNSPRKKALQMADNEGASPVIVACQNGNAEQLRLLLEAEAPAAGKDRFKRCALHHCVENTDTECAELLLRAAPSMLNTADEEGLTPLHMAVIAGNVPLIEMLLAKGANLNAVDNEKHSVAHWATVCGHTAVLDVLLARGAKLSSPDKYQAFPIHYAAQMMSKKGSDSENSSSEDGGSIQILKTLLNKKVSTEVEDKDKRTPIIWAASAGSSDACRVLMENGANVDRADKDDLTALHCAASRGHSSCVETLVRHCKAKVDPVDKNQCTPLFYATTLGHVNTLKTLLDLKADCSHTDTRGRTVAHCATVSGAVEVLDILKRHHVDLWSRNLKGDQPLHEAAQAGHTDILQYLLVHDDHQKDAVNGANNDGRTCLHIAALTNNAWLCHWLMDKKANVNAIMKNKGKFYSPYDAALVKGHTEVKDILLNRGGRPGSVISNRAAQTIQVKYRYHHKRRNRKESFTSPKVKNRRQDSKEKQKDKEKYTGNEKDEESNKDKEKATDKGQDKEKDKGKSPSPTRKQDSPSPKSPRSPGKKEVEGVQRENAAKVSAAAAVLATQVAKDKDENTEQEESEERDETLKPVYVDRGTQVSGVSSGSPGREIVTKKDLRKKKHKHRGDSRSIDKAESVSNEKRVDKGETKSLDQVHASPVTAVTAANAVKHKYGKDEEQSCDDVDVLSDRSSSHGNVSDVESSSSDVIHHKKFLKRSPAVRIRTRLSKNQKVSHPSSEENEDKREKDDKLQESNVKSPKGSASAESSSISGNSNRSPRALRLASDKDSVSLTPRSNASPRERPRTSSHDSPIDSKRQEQKGKTGSGSDRGRTSQRSDHFDSTQRTSAEEEMGSWFSSRKTRPSNGVKGSTDKSEEDIGADDGMNGHLPNGIDDDQGYTDTEEWASPGGKDPETPRRKKTRPNKLISRVQESVKRYEAERTSIRQLHQIRRAQIYSGPVYDVALFRKIVDNVNSKYSKDSNVTVTTTAETWEGYLQEQMKIIQEERKMHSGRPATSPCGKPGSESPNRGNKGHNPVFPQPHPGSRKGREATPGEDGPRTEFLGLRLRQSSHDRAAQPTTGTTAANVNKNDSSRTASARQPKLVRAHTAHVSRNFGTGIKRQDTAGGNARYYESLRQKHEWQKQRLIDAYKPFGGAELLNGLPRSRPVMTHPRPTSTMSSKTATSSGSHASARQSRTLTYTIMTPYGSRKVREPWDVRRRPDTSYHSTRARQPLVFQEPDIYEKERKNERMQAKEAS